MTIRIAPSLSTSTGFPPSSGRSATHPLLLMNTLTPALNLTRNCAGIATRPLSNDKSHSSMNIPPSHAGIKERPKCDYLLTGVAAPDCSPNIKLLGIVNQNIAVCQMNTSAPQSAKFDQNDEYIKTRFLLHRVGFSPLPKHFIKFFHLFGCNTS